MDPFLGEIRMFAGNFAPVNWMLCQGQSLQIATNDALFSLIGTTYGGDGDTTFNLPDLRGRVPIHQVASTFPLGMMAGAEGVTLTSNQIPAHSHAFNASTAKAAAATPANNVLAAVDGTQGQFLYRESSPSSNTMSTAIVMPAGSSVAHSNLQPYACINFIIAIAGIFPQQP